MTEPLLRTEQLVKRYGGLLATDNVSIDVRPGEIHALIGPNGAGKTTLVHQLTGVVAPDSGTIRFAGRDVTRLPTHARVRLGLERARLGDVEAARACWRRRQGWAWPRPRRAALGGSFRARSPWPWAARAVWSGASIPWVWVLA